MANEIGIAHVNWAILIISRLVLRIKIWNVLTNKDTPAYALLSFAYLSFAFLGLSYFARNLE